MPHPIDTGTRTNVTPTVSNGTTAVPFGPIADPKKQVFVGGLYFRNAGSVTHTVQILSSGGAVLAKFDLAASPCSHLLDGRAGRWETELGESLQFKIDSGGTGTDVEVSGHVIQK